MDLMYWPTFFRLKHGTGTVDAKTSDRTLHVADNSCQSDQLSLFPGPLYSPGTRRSTDSRTSAESTGCTFIGITGEPNAAAAPREPVANALACASAPVRNVPPEYEGSWRSRYEPRGGISVMSADTGVNYELTDASNKILSCFLGMAARVQRILGSQAVAERWCNPSALEGYSGAEDAPRNKETSRAGPSALVREVGSGRQRCPEDSPRRP